MDVLIKELIIVAGKISSIKGKNWHRQKLSHWKILRPYHTFITKMISIISLILKYICRHLWQNQKCFHPWWKTSR